MENIPRTSRWGRVSGTPATTPQPRRLDAMFGCSTVRHDQRPQTSLWASTENGENSSKKYMDFEPKRDWQTGEDLSPDSRVLFEALEEAQQLQKKIDRETGIPSASSISFISKVFPASDKRVQRCGLQSAEVSNAAPRRVDFVGENIHHASQDTPHGSLQFPVVKRTLQYTAGTCHGTQQKPRSYRQLEHEQASNLFGDNQNQDHQYSTAGGSVPKSAVSFERSSPANAENLEHSSIERNIPYGTASSFVDTARTPHAQSVSQMTGKRLFMTSGKSSSPREQWATPVDNHQAYIGAPHSNRSHDSTASSCDLTPHAKMVGSPVSSKITRSGGSTCSHLLLSPMQPSSGSRVRARAPSSSSHTPNRISRKLAGRLRLDSVESGDEAIVNLVSPEKSSETLGCEEELEVVLDGETSVVSSARETLDITQDHSEDASRVKQLRTSPSAIDVMRMPADQTARDVGSGSRHDLEAAEAECVEETVEEVEVSLTEDTGEKSEQEMMDESERLARQLMMEEEAALLERIQEEQMRMIQQMRDTEGVSEDLVMALQLASQDQSAEAGEEEQEGEIDPDDMTYDQLLALGEQLGDVSKERWRTAGRAIVEALCIVPFQKERSRFDELLRASESGKHLSSEYIYADPKCVVCQYTYEEEEALKVLPCGHGFHSECIDGWLIENKTCVTCKRSIDPNEQDD